MATNQVKLARKASKPVNAPAAEDSEESNKITNGNNGSIYQIANEIGRGAFAIVYKAFDASVGKMVAVKRFPLRNIDKEALSNIESEIELMQKLDHPNIVKYMETIKTSAYLYIVLEWMDGGSLAQIVKEFGCNESLAAKYITQILNGLQYLHNQGVLHRDIKGANILTEKSGVVKLADFGVALKVNDNPGYDPFGVVGSPYWMAPEIVNSPPTAACDIWSLGCTVIELLTGAPPYYHLKQHQALYRIVQDENPPIPEGISPALTDFLLFHCFQKDPHKRASAAQLLRHPWLQISSNKIPQTVSSSATSATVEAAEISSRRSSARRPIDPSQQMTPTAAEVAAAGIADSSSRELSSGDENSKAKGSKRNPAFPLSPRASKAASPRITKSQDTFTDNETLMRKGLIPSDDHEGSHPVHITVSSKQSSAAHLSAESKDETLDNKRFNEKIKPLLADSRNGSGRAKDKRFFDGNLDNMSEESPEAQWDADFIDESFDGSNDESVVTPNPKDLLNNSPYSSINNKNRRQESMIPIKQLQSQSSSASAPPRDELQPTYLATRTKSEVESVASFSGSFLVNEGTSSAMKNNRIFSPHHSSISLLRFQEKNEDENFDDLFDQSVHNQNDNNLKDENHSSAPTPKAITSGGTARKISLQEFMESDKSEAETPPKMLPSLPTVGNGLKKKTTKESLVAISASSHDFSDDLVLEDDKGKVDFAKKLKEKIMTKATAKQEPPEDEFEEFLANQFDEKDYMPKEQKDVHGRRSRDIVDLLSSLRPSLTEEEVRTTADQVIDIFNLYPDQREHLIRHHGVMPILDMFETRPRSDTNMEHAWMSYKTFAYYVLKITNKIIEDSVRVQEQLSLVGIIPVVMALFERSFKLPSPVPRTIAPFPVQPFADNRTLLMNDLFARPDAHSLTERNRAASIDCRIVETVTYEAAFFMHQIAQASPLALQMLIGAGGLAMLTSMVSFGCFLDISSFDRDRKNSNNTHNGGNGNANGGGIEDDDSTDEDHEVEPVRAVSFLEIPTIVTAPANDNNAAMCMEIFQMGINCITKVFSVQPSRGRDFCRLFVKLGLLPHLAGSFSNLMIVFKQSLSSSDSPAHNLQRRLTKSNSDSAKIPNHSSAFKASSLGATTTNAGGEEKSSPHRRSEALASPIARSFTEVMCHHLESGNQGETSLEGTYALAIATLFLQFSRSDSIVAEIMANEDRGVIAAIVETISAPELRASDGSHQSHFSMLSQKNLTLHNSSSASASSHNISAPFVRRQLTKSTMHPLYMDIVDLLLKCLKNLTMGPSTLDDLGRAGAMEALVPLLKGSINESCKNTVLQSIFNMCRINRRMQDTAAAQGIVPILKKVVQDKSHMKEIALTILLDFAHTSTTARSELWKHDCVPFFVDLFELEYWNEKAVNSISAWLSNDVTNVGRMLVQPMYLSKLINFFKDSKPTALHTIHKPLLDMALKSKDVATALSASGIFVSTLVRRLNTTEEAIVLCSLLRIVQLLHQYHSCPRQLVLDNNLYAIVRKFAQAENQVMVSQLANRLLADFQLSTLT